MLYNKNWDAKTVTSDPLALESLIAWLEKQPARKAYDFFCQGECMVGQWVKSVDPMSGPADGWGASYYVVNGKIHDLSKFVQIANDGNNRFTFGAALNRARAALDRA